jgi:hypothetical protein
LRRDDGPFARLSGATVGPARHRGTTFRERAGDHLGSDGIEFGPDDARTGLAERSGGRADGQWQDVERLDLAETSHGLLPRSDHELGHESADLGESDP